jgi:hypothetical protein
VSKQSGLGDNFWLNGYNLSGDTGSLGRIGGGPALQDVTGIDKSAFERKGLKFDGGISWQAWYNDAALAAHPALSSLLRTDRIATYCRGTAIGAPAAGAVLKQINYDPDRGADGALTINVEGQASAGSPLEWGVLLTASPRTDTGATNGTSHDAGASSAFGLQAFLHVNSFTGTDATVSIQSSSDNGAGDAFATITSGSFTQITGSAPLAERIATATGQAVERYLRVVTTTTGGFSNLSFVVAVVRNEIAVQYA